MSFRSVFIAVVIAFGLIVGAFLINRARPRVETEQPTEALNLHSRFNDAHLVILPE